MRHVAQRDGISIHALREEGDHNCPALRCGSPFISIHALREEGDRVRCLRGSVRHSFLSTPSARRATLIRIENQLDPKYFYPRPPRGGRRLNVQVNSIFKIISIHALREEGDQE